MPLLKKIGILGESGAGKRTLFKKAFDPFKDTEFYLDKLGVSVGKSVFQYNHNGNAITMGMIAWDMTGQKEFDIYRPSYCQSAEGAVIVSRSDRPLQETENYAKFARKAAGNVPIMFLVNKIAGHQMLEIERYLLDDKWAKEYNAEVRYLNFKRCKPETLKEPFRQLGKRMLDDTEAGPWDDPG